MHRVRLAHQNRRLQFSDSLAEPQLNLKLQVSLSSEVVSVMAQSCAATSSSIAVFTALSSRSRNESHSLSLRFNPLRTRRSIVSAASRGRKCQNFKVNASYLGGFSTVDDYESTWQGDIWSIRNDLEVPSSPYIPIYGQGDEGPSPMVHERFQNVLTQLFQYRVIRCGGPVDDDMANILVSQLLYLDAMDPTKDIIMYVNSPGGSVTAGMAVFDTIRHIRPDVCTVCVGLAASMGAFLLSAGTKGKRYSLPNSRIMIHQPLGGAQGGQSDIDIQANEMLYHKANLNGYLCYHTGQSLEKINQDTDRDFFMSAQEAQDYGLIDGVIINPHKVLQPLVAAADQ
ncbi:hypothetical protein Ddye_027391 [Dipteronia dyeriana]|uniref:ATP-dependent Clp protease proteolytic subunit n=1 Tax=Dipteronia dyeriana TaxID=168575 RepID=A0AAD9TP79_9ROSI|nr:hypothetical protein Ddye_027391 [Dipteronia dyeriana]